jgi:hypothetical protein
MILTLICGSALLSADADLLAYNTVLNPVTGGKKIVGRHGTSGRQNMGSYRLSPTTSPSQIFYARQKWRQGDW